MKKIMSILMISVMLVSSTVVVNAASYTENSKGRSFADDWSATPINTSERTFKYGYNTTLINEDYTHTYHRTKTHHAYVKNTGTVEDSKGTSGNYAKSEITHHAGTVYYRYYY